MRVVFAGTPDVAVPTLQAIVTAGHEVALVLTREDAPRGRKRIMTPSEVAVAAEKLGLPVLKTNRIDAVVIERIREVQADLGVIVAYGALLRADALDALPLGWINLHFSLLPAWRGAAPVQRNLMAGGPFGVTVFQLDEGVDTGDVWRSQAIDVTADETAGDVLARFASLGTPVVLDSIAEIERSGAPIAQDGAPSHAAKLRSEEGLIDPEGGLANSYATFRGVTPEPGAFLMLENERVKVLEARASDVAHSVGSLVAGDAGAVLLGTGDGSLVLRTVQPAGKSAMNAADWLRGRR